jgi:hypothetical protein
MRSHFQRNSVDVAHPSDATHSCSGNVSRLRCLTLVIDAPASGSEMDCAIVGPKSISLVSSVGMNRGQGAAPRVRTRKAALAVLRNLSVGRGTARRQCHGNMYRGNMHRIRPRVAVDHCCRSVRVAAHAALHGRLSKRGVIDSICPVIRIVSVSIVLALIVTTTQWAAHAYAHEYGAPLSVNSLANPDQAPSGNSMGGDCSHCEHFGAHLIALESEPATVALSCCNTFRRLPDLLLSPLRLPPPGPPPKHSA